MSWNWKSLMCCPSLLFKRKFRGYSNLQSSPEITDLSLPGLSRDCRLKTLILAMDILSPLCSPDTDHPPRHGDTSEDKVGDVDTVLNVIFPNKTTPFPRSLVVDPWRIGVILTSGDGVQMSVSSFGKTWHVAWNYTRLEWIHSNLVWIHSRLDQTKSDFQTFGSTAQPMMQIWKKFFHILTSNC